jgi:hypothetical protein
MDYIFYGALFVFLSFSVKFGSNSIDIGPDAVGWFLIYYGLKQLQFTDRHFTELKVPLFILIGLTGLSFVCNLLGIVNVGGLLQMIAGIISIFVMIKLLNGFIAIKDSFNTPTEPLRLKKRYITSIILGAVLAFISFITAIFVVMSISWASISVLVSDIRVNPELALNSFVNTFPQVIAGVIIWGILMFIGVIVLIIFLILILNSFYRLYKDYNPSVVNTDPLPLE